MGIPYSAQISAAFEEVTPLVAAGFQVLQTTKNIAIIVAVVQVLTALLLALILIVLLGILISVNQDLSNERKKLVTPVMRWASSWLMDGGALFEGAMLIVGLAFVGALIAYGMFLWRGTLVGYRIDSVDESEGEGESEDKKEGKS